MRDAKGRELKVGDTVMIPCKIKQIHASEDFCNVDLESIATMPGNDMKSGFSAINTRQVLRANPEDSLSYTVTLAGAATKLS